LGKVVASSPLFLIFMKPNHYIMKRYFLLLLLVTAFSYSQTKVKDTITRKATIAYDQNGNKVILKAETPPLIQVAGAPKANFTYFWEMGDGAFSKKPNPKHTYKKKGEYKVNLAVTNNYDNGKPPQTRPKTVAVNDISDSGFDEIASLPDSASYKIFANREPVPDEEMVVVVSYKNPLQYVANGKLYLFYNDKEFKNDNFELMESRTHFGEREVFEDRFACSDELNDNSILLASLTSEFIKNTKVSANDENLELTLLESGSLFKKVMILEFDGMDPNETRNAFFTFKTSPKMIKDTSATVKIRGVYVPDRSYKNHVKKTLEMEIVTSHDPNKMSSNGMFINYRLVRLKTLNFKTQFQNDGEGPARTIRLETDIPDMFDKKTLKIVDSYPKCPICPKNEEVSYSCLDTIIKQKQIYFTFKNIYVPGSNQKNVTEKDSTKGFVKYTMKLAKDFHKQTTHSRTAIIFDKNEPVITNYATTRFLPGISIGAKAGYNLFSDQKNAKSYFVGATISPYKSYRFYWQSELYYNYFESSFSSQSEIHQTQFNPPIILSNGTVFDTGFEQTSSSTKTVKNLADVVPISLRYNINNYIGIGVGPQFSVLLSQSTEINQNRKVFAPNFNTNPVSPGDEIESMSSSTSQTEKIKTFEKMQTSIFGDVTFGFARIGPSLGIRYYANFEKDFNYWQFYAIWKF
jgi:PKD repeat protein